MERIRRPATYIPQCDLLNPRRPTAGCCGPIAISAFGTNRAGELYDKDLTTGWGHRPANWEFSVGVQRRDHPARRARRRLLPPLWENFQVTDNLLLAPEDFTAFNLTVPRSDPRLSSSGAHA